MAGVLTDKNGDFPKFPEPVPDNDPELIAQRAVNAIQLFEGEWMLDKREGLPWLRWLRTAPPPVNEIQTVVRAELIDVEGIVGADVTVDFVDEEIQIEATVETSDRTTLDIDLDAQQHPNGFHPIFTSNILLLD